MILFSSFLSRLTTWSKLCFQPSRDGCLHCVPCSTKGNVYCILIAVAYSRAVLPKLQGAKMRQIDLRQASVFEWMPHIWQCNVKAVTIGNKLRRANIGWWAWKSWSQHYDKWACTHSDHARSCVSNACFDLPAFVHRKISVRKNSSTCDFSPSYPETAVSYEKLIT